MVKAGNFGMEMCISGTSRESDFATVSGLLLSPLVHSCFVAYELKGSMEFTSLQGFQQSLAMLSPLCSTPQHVLCGESWACWPLSIQGVAAKFHSKISVLL